MPTLTLVAERTPLRAYELSGLVVNIGRSDDMDVVIDNPSVSRRQAQIRLKEDGTWIVQDLDSANGTFLNGRRLTAAQPLARGDEISFGKFSIFFDRALKEPVAAKPTVKADLPRPTETFQMDLKDIERLQLNGAMKRRAHLKWEAAGKADTFYLERFERSAVLIGRSVLCDLRVPAGPRHHVLVIRNRLGVEVRNLSRWHRVRVNGAVVTQALLQDGDVIEVRGLRLTFFAEIG